MDGNSQLFRKQAIESAGLKTGNPFANPGLSLQWLSVGMFLLLLAVGAFVTTATYTKRETVFGEVVPAAGVARVVSLRAGTIKHVFVKNGDKVVKGQPLFLISYDTVLANGNSFSDKLNENSRQQLAETISQANFKKQQILQTEREDALKLETLRDDIDRQQEEQRLQADRIKLLQQSVDAANDLIGRQYISQLQVRQREDALIQAKQNLLQVAQTIAQDKSQISQLREEIKASRQSYLEADAAMKLNKSQLEEKELTNQLQQSDQIVAMKDGEVTSVEVKDGDSITNNQTLGLVVPVNSKVSHQVQLWVPSRAIGFLQSNASVRIMYDAFPYQTFGVGTGKVSQISSAPVLPSDIPVPIDTKEQMYLVSVALDDDKLQAYGRYWPLISGMRLSADLVLDQKSLLDWTLDPILAESKRSK